MGEKSRLISWIWQSAGHTGGIVGADIRASIWVEWCKAYARVKRWGEEVLLLQEEMKRCLLTLEWQATIWDQRAEPGHYTGTIVYSPIHREGAMALAARQAALRRKLANRFRKLWWSLGGIERPQAASSSESSGNDAGYGFNGGNGSDAESEADEDEPAARESSRRGEVAAEVNAEEESDAEGAEEDVSREETATRRARMDELLAIQSTSIGQYNDM
jgi:hypothetical protein